MTAGISDRRELAEALGVDSGRASGRRLPFWKRAMDIVGAGLGLFLLSPLLAIIAVAIRLETPGGALYRHRRVGKGGRTFTCSKFRSMYAGADREREALAEQNEANGHIFKMQDDPRRTRVGRVLRKTSLDELPQLWDVLRGEMSLVGPRPPLPDEVALYEERHTQRLQGVPGITGLWQVRARDRHDFEEMVALDIQYLRDVSFQHDLKILLLTVPTVLRGRGSY